MEITKDSNIREVIEAYPDTLELFLEAGIHCFGCALAHFETLEEGLMAHGLPEEAIDKFVEDLNKIVKKSQPK